MQQDNVNLNVSKDILSFYPKTIDTFKITSVITGPELNLKLKKFNFSLCSCTVQVILSNERDDRCNNRIVT